jgi:hypothetical protein
MVEKNVERKEKNRGKRAFEEHTEANDSVDFEGDVTYLCDDLLH